MMKATRNNKIIESKIKLDKNKSKSQRKYLFDRIHCHIHIHTYMLLSRIVIMEDIFNNKIIQMTMLYPYMQCTNIFISIWYTTCCYYMDYTLHQRLPN